MSESTECYETPQYVVNWIKQTSERTEFFKNVSVLPFGEVCLIYPKDMPKDKVIQKLNKYWRVYSK